MDEFKRTARRDMHGREARVCVCARGAVGWTVLPTKSGVRYFPSIQKLASRARRPPAEPRRLPHPPGTGLAAPVGLRRLAHRALVAQP